MQEWKQELKIFRICKEFKSFQIIPSFKTCYFFTFELNFFLKKKSLFNIIQGIPNVALVYIKKNNVIS